MDRLVERHLIWKAEFAKYQHSSQASSPSPKHPKVQASSSLSVAGVIDKVSPVVLRRMALQPTRQGDSIAELSNDGLPNGVSVYLPENQLFPGQEHRPLSQAVGRISLP